MGEVTIRPFRPDDLPAVLEVLRLALGETPLLQRTPGLWRWKHVDNPFGPSLVLVADVDGEIAGVRAMMRWDLLTREGKTLRCLRPVDTATHPGFVRRGIFKSLTLEALRLAEAQGIDLLFNTPNQASEPGYLKMGWQEVGPVGVMIRPLFRSGSRVSELTPLDPDEFLLGASQVSVPLVEDRPPLGLRTSRTAAYFRWRFSSHPTARYRMWGVDGRAVILRPNLRSRRKEIVVSELLGIPPRRILREVAARSRASYLVGWFSPGTPERRAAVLGGLIPVPWIRALTLVARPLHELPIDVFSMRNWDLSLGDLELL